jgi:hypothetical protein
MCLRLLRAEVWAQSDVKRLHRVDVRSLPKTASNDIAVIVVSRLVVIGGKHHRLHEELTSVGGYLRDVSFAREASVARVSEWSDTAKTFSPSERLMEGLRRRFEKHREAVLQAVEARSRDRLKSLETTLETRKQKEMDDIAGVLDELARTIEIELRKEKEPEQLKLFSDDERTQVRRDAEALKARLVRIPAEKEAEVEAIRQRFAAYTVRTFPVAVIFLVPEGHPWRADA